MINYKELFLLQNKKVLLVGDDRMTDAVSRDLAVRGAETSVIRSVETEELQILENLKNVFAELGDPDVLIISSGSNDILGGKETPNGFWNRMSDQHVRRAHIVTREVGKRMLAHGFGRIIYLSDSSGPEVTSEYLICESALSMYARQIACEWAERGITSNVLTVKEFQEDTCDKVCSYIEYLASEAAEFVTGQVLTP